MKKFLVVEDHALVREGLTRLLTQLGSDVKVREAADFEAALVVLDSTAGFDLILLDLALPRIDGFAGLDILRRRYPAVPVAVLSAFDDGPTINRVLNLGAAGFIPKTYSGEALLGAIRAILQGTTYRPRKNGGARLDDLTPLPPVGTTGITPADIGLTERQAQVLCLMVRGLSNREIAQTLELSEGTVKIHATAVFKVLGVNSRAQALVTVTRYGIDFEGVF